MNRSTTQRRRGAALTLVVALVLSLWATGSTPAGAVNYPQTTVVSAQPISKTPYVLDGTVYTIAPVGNTVYVGGDFTTVKNPGGAPKQNIVDLFAYDNRTGQLSTTWLPKVDGQINAVAAAPDGGILIAGRFKTVNGVAAPYLAKLDPTTGQVMTNFTPGVNGWIEDMKVSGNSVYIGGYFTKERGVSAVSLGRVDATTGKPDASFAFPATQPTKGSTRVNSLDVSGDGSRLVITGNFQQIAGQPRSEIAVIDLRSNALANWSTNRFGPTDCSSVFDTYMRDVDISPDGSYFVAVTTGAWHGTSTMCDSASRWSLQTSGSGLQPTWVDYSGGDTFTAVAVTNAAVYVGGHMRWLNNTNITGESRGPSAVDRPGLAALDPQNGVPLTWNPTRDRGVGVFAMVATADGLYIGDDTNVVANEWHPRLAFFPLAGGTTNPVLTPNGLPGDLYQIDSRANLSARSFDGSSMGTARNVPVGSALGGVRGAFLLDGQLYTANSDGHLYKRSFDGRTGALGSPVDLSSWTSFASVTSFFYDGGRIYYTRANDSRLYYRYFTTESNVVGSQELVASGNGDGFNWSTARGMTANGGYLFTATSDGNLHRVGWVGGAPNGTDQVIAGPALRGPSYTGAGLFVGPLTGL